VRLQLDRGGKTTSYSHASDLTDAELGSAPDISTGPNSVRLIGSEYRIRVNLPAESGGPRASGDIIIRAVPGQSLPPFTMRGAGGWVSGYVVPVMAGQLDGEIGIGRETVDLTGGAGYHDHNWGFWEGVRWQWGHVFSRRPTPLTARDSLDFSSQWDAKARSGMRRTFRSTNWMRLRALSLVASSSPGAATRSRSRLTSQ
jgi:hypothetical protein